ncbi:hypothetical protein E2C01_000879 [Portunus trituberculatus]|uniref:Uncharacterized protein n=1 Tax=Portunus trituberculatus TaxID=210409 RepID=A0A5B7CGA7_PORTR|nr:hypothetical protein [Portunus trituberculatus]
MEALCPSPAIVSLVPPSFLSSKNLTSPHYSSDRSRDNSRQEMLSAAIPQLIQFTLESGEARGRLG